MDGIKMEKKRINVVKKWPELKLVWDIQIFIDFANFYRCFIKHFSKIAASLIVMLKITESSITSVSKVDDDEIISGGGAIGRSAVSWSDALKKLVKSKSRAKNGHLSNNNNTEEPKFLTPKAKKGFNRLRQAFIKAPILQYFDLECHIRIETDASSYAIGEVLS